MKFYCTKDCFHGGKLYKKRFFYDPQDVPPPVPDSLKAVKSKEKNGNKLDKNSELRSR